MDVANTAVQHMALGPPRGAPPDADPAVVGWFRSLPLRVESYHAARQRVLELFELEYLTWLLRRSGGNMSKAARVAGMDRTWLYRLLDRNHLTRDGGAAPRPPATPERELVFDAEGAAL
jgi:DNA-binding NtrC family response regulator